MSQQQMNAIDEQAEIDLEQQLSLLRDLLRIERLNGEQRRQNNASLQKYIEQLQTDYLRQQSDLVQALEFSHKLKGQQAAQLACLEGSLSEKDTQLERLKGQLASLDEQALRQELTQTLEKQHQLERAKQDQLRAQVEATQESLDRERAHSSQVIAQLQAKLEDQLRAQAGELESWRARLAAAQEELERLLGEPQNLIIRALREEKSALGARAEELQMGLEESQARYESLRRRLDELLVEQRQAAEAHRAEQDELQAVQGEQRRAVQALKLELEDKDEVNQILQFNLARSERRVKNLLASLKAKESTYRELVQANELKHQAEVERLRGELQSHEKRLIECESEVGRKQNELVRLQLEQENQLESLRNDRDERVRRVTQERAAMEQELRATELKFARELEEARRATEEAERCGRELELMRAESKRLSLELAQREARLHAAQQELSQANARQRELEAGRLAANSDGDSPGAAVERLERELEGERNLAKRLKQNYEELGKQNEKLRVKLKLAEASMDQMGSMLKREHAKMMMDYERRLESIRGEQVVFERNKLRYKRYGYKLKKYCEHLRRVHAHLCSPANCGYQISGPAQARDYASLSLNGGAEQSNGSPPEDDHLDLHFAEKGAAGTSSSSETSAYEGVYESIDSPSPGTLKARLAGGANESFRQSTGSSQRRHSPERFLIKRTGGCALELNTLQQQPAEVLQPAKARAKLSFRDASRQHHQQPPPPPQSRTPLKMRTNFPERSQAAPATGKANPPTLEPTKGRRPTGSAPTENDDRHAYYYIRREASHEQQQRTPSSGRRAISATTSKPLTPVAACRQTKLSLARAKARQQQQQQRGSPVSGAVLI